MQKRFIFHNDGVTLIENILAIAIIAIGLFCVMSVVTIVTKGNTHSKRVTTATTMAQDKMEYFNKVDYSDVLGTSTVTTDYYLVAVVQNDTPSANTKTITVNVYWDPADATSSHKVELQTILAEE